MKKYIVRLTVGMAILVFSIICITYISRRVLNLYEAALLRWVPILSTFIAFYLAGFITKEVKLSYISLLFLGLLIFIPLQFFYFPFLIYLLFFAALGLLLNRREFKEKIKIFSSIIGLVLFVFILFSQALIIRQKDFKVAEDGSLIHAKVLWDFEKKQPKVLPEEVFYTLENENLSLQNFEGKTLYISFWATWCGVCLAEKPMLDKLKEEMKGNEEVVFIDISIDKNKSKWESFLNKNNSHGVQLLSQNESLTRRNFEIIGVPMHLIVNEQQQYKSLRNIQNAKVFLEDKEKLNRWIQSGREIVEK